MSRIYGQNINTVPWQGSAPPQDFNFFKPSAFTPKIVPIYIDWKIYNGNGAKSSIGVDVKLVGVNQPIALDKIACVYIDNTGSNVPVYVYFPDTKHTIVCGPSSTIQQNVITNSNAAQIYGIGFTGGVQPITTVYFSNFDLPIVAGPDTAFVAPQYLASVYSGNPVVNQTPYRALALGDLQASSTVSILKNVNGLGDAAIANLVNTNTGGAVQSTVTFPFTGANQYIYINAITLRLRARARPFTGSYVDATHYPATILGAFNVGFHDTTNFINWRIPFEIDRNPNSSTVSIDETFINLTGLQSKAPANLTFQLGIDNTPLFSGNSASVNTVCTDTGSVTMIIQYTARDESQSAI